MKFADEFVADCVIKEFPDIPDLRKKYHSRNRRDYLLDVYRLARRRREAEAYIWHGDDDDQEAVEDGTTEQEESKTSPTSTTVSPEIAFRNGVSGIDSTKETSKTGLTPGVGVVEEDTQEFEFGSF